MGEQIKWALSGPVTRKAVVELCGWANKKGDATPTGRRIAHSSWDELSPAARNVLMNHGVVKF
jgi:hypothetical protein